MGKSEIIGQFKMKPKLFQKNSIIVQCILSIALKNLTVSKNNLAF